MTIDIRHHTQQYHIVDQEREWRDYRPVASVEALGAAEGGGGEGLVKETVALGTKHSGQSRAYYMCLVSRK